VLLEDYYQRDLANHDNYELNPLLNEYFVPYFNTYNEYLAFIDGMSLNAPPGIYGFHANANITKELNETQLLLNTLLNCQGGGAASKSGEDSSAVSPLDQIIGFISKIIAETPEAFNVAETREKYPPKREESMNIILLQELERYNKLVGVIRSNLTSIKDALQGTIVFSFELEEALNFIKVNKVPKVWMDSSYPSLKPLPAYMQNLRERVDFFKKWVLEGKPPVYWLSGLYFPQGFLTGILQNFARKHNIAIDKLKYDFEVLPAGQELKAGAEDGAYVNGFFLEGAKFDYSRMCLSESDPKVAVFDAGAVCGGTDHVLQAGRSQRLAAHRRAPRGQRLLRVPPVPHGRQARRAADHGPLDELRDDDPHPVGGRRATLDQARSRSADPAEHLT